MKIPLFCFALCVLLLTVRAAQANTFLGEFEQQMLIPGDVLDMEVHLQRSADQRLEVRLLDPPQRAKLVSSDGKLYLQWESGPDMKQDTVISIEVRDFDTQQVLDTGRVRVSRAATEELIPGQPLPAEQTDQPAISLRPVSSQIVSVGKAISVIVAGESSDGEVPVITIDRVPANASFEQNEDGHYLFFWLTTGRNQGEHTFLVTATHPFRDANIAQSQFTVFIGDPSLGKTVPADSAATE